MTISAFPAFKPAMLMGRGREERARAALPRGRLVFVPSGRQALYLALRSVGVSRGDAVLLPSYLCPAVVAPLRELGAQPVFYGVDGHLRIDLDDLTAIVRQETCKALVLVHYFGFPDPQLDAVLGLAREHGMPVIEDCAHALYGQRDGKPLGSFGTAAVFSLRKSLATPEGGVLRLAEDAVLPPLDERAHWERAGLAKLLVYALEAKSPISLRGRLLASERVRYRAYERDARSPVVPGRTMGRLSWRIFSTADPEAIVARRRRNFLHALGRFVELDAPGVRPLTHGLPDGVCPLGLPLTIERGRASLQRRLYRQGFVLPAMWEDLPAAVPLDRYPDAARLRDSILVLPVHQDLETEHIDRMIAALAQGVAR